LFTRQRGRELKRGLSKWMMIIRAVPGRGERRKVLENTPSFSQGDLMPLMTNLEMQSIPGGRVPAAARRFLDR